jgi:hypothetical protein
MMDSPFLPRRLPCQPPLYVDTSLVLNGIADGRGFKVAFELRELKVEIPVQKVQESSLHEIDDSISSRARCRVVGLEAVSLRP